MAKTTKTLQEIIPDELMVPLLLAIPAKTPGVKRRAAMKKSLLARMAKLAGQHADERRALIPTEDYLLVRAAAGRWITFAPNVAMKVLHDDGTTRSWLARFSPGGRIPTHIQSGDEEAIILEGWCYLDDVRINAGDYHMIGKGARHGNIHSPDGCLIFVRSHSEKRRASELTVAR